MKFLGRGLGGLAIIAAGILLAGCQTGQRADYKFDPLSANPTMTADGGSPAAPVPVTFAQAVNPPASVTRTPAPAPMPAMPIAATASAAPADISVTQVHVGDDIMVTFGDIPNTFPPIDNTIKEDGSITLAYDQKFQAAGKTIGALQTEIRERYVPAYWKYLTVTIKIQDRFYFIGGEVRQPGRQVYTGYMTVLRAIDTAGGFTDYAWKSHTTVTRADGKKLKEDCSRALTKPELDLQVFPGDRINVAKRPF